MAITNSAGDGVRVTTAAVTETLGSQAQANGSNEIVMSNTFAALNNGNVNATADYSGDNRKIILRRGGSAGSPANIEETRYIVSQTAGTGTTVILTVNEPWLFPPSSGDLADISYNLDDAETTGASVTLNSKTGVYEFSRQFTVGDATNFAYFAIVNGSAIELDDDGNTNYTCSVENAARMDVGYEQGGEGIQGGFVYSVHNTAGEDAFEVVNGGIFRGYNFLLISQRVITEQNVATGADVEVNGAQWNTATFEAKLLDGTWRNLTIAGSLQTTENIRIGEETLIDGAILANTNGFTTATGDTTTETLTLRNVTFIGNNINITVNSNKTWDVFNPVWTIDTTTQNDISFLTGTNNEVNEGYTLDLVIKQADGSVLEGARVFLYEGLLNDDLVLELSTDVDGVVSDGWAYNTYTDNAGTSLNTSQTGNHALRVFDYTFTPFIASQTSNEKLDTSITLVPDTAISETDQGTAITTGAGILPVRHALGESDPRPMKVIKYDAGTGGLPVVGETMTQGSATGSVVEYIGNAVAGWLVLESWNGTEFADNSNITGGTGTFDATTDTAGFYQEYTWEVDCNNKSLQITYDYLAARMAQGGGSPALLQPIFEQVHEWGKEDQSQLLYSGATGYFTERSFSAGSPLAGEGVWLSNAGAGTIAYLTSDAGVKFTNIVAPITVQGVTEGAAVKVVANETVGTVTSGDVILEALADNNGEASTSITYETAFDPSGLDVIARVRASGLPTAAIQDDNGVFTDETTAANSAVAADMNLLPATPVAGQDRYLFGHAEKFGKLKIDINTAATGNYDIVWQYWNGSTWADLTGVIDGTVDGGSPLSQKAFSVTGVNYVEWTIPGDWATTTINSQGPYYYIRAALVAGTVTTSPTGTRCSLDVTKYLPFVQNGTVTADGLTVTASWVEDTIATF